MTFVATTRSPAHHAAVFRKMGVATTSGRTVVASPSSPSVRLLDLHDPDVSLPDGTLVASQLMVAVEASMALAAAQSAAAAALPSHRTGHVLPPSPPSSSNSPAATAPHLLILEDVAGLVERCESPGMAQQLLARLLSAASPAAKRPPLPTHSHSHPKPNFVTLRCTPDADWALPPPAGLPLCATPFTLSLLEWLRAEAHVLVRLAALPSGYSRDVHGRLLVTTGLRPAAAETAAAASPTPYYEQPLVKSVLVRVGTDGTVRAVGDVSVAALRGGPSTTGTTTTTTTGRKGVGVKGTATTRAAKVGGDDDGDGDDAIAALPPDPDQLDGEYD